jgi:hypothetical protein
MNDAIAVLCITHDRALPEISFSSQRRIGRRDNQNRMDSSVCSVALAHMVVGSSGYGTRDGRVQQGYVNVLDCQ